MDDIQTDPELLARLRAAAARPMTSAEAFEQRVSFVYGCMDADSSVSKDQVRAILARDSTPAQPLAAAKGLPPEACDIRDVMEDVDVHALFCVKRAEGGSKVDTATSRLAVQSSVEAYARQAVAQALADAPKPGEKP